MKRFAAALVAAVIVAAPATAQDAVSDHVGMIGFGYFTADAPVGVRYWMSPTLGFDVGIGFKMENQQFIDDDGDPTTPDTDESTLDFAFEAGVLVPLASDENMILFVRPGIGFASEDMVVTDGTTGEESFEGETTFSISGMIGVELFMTKLGFPNLSLAGGHGVKFETVSPAGDGDSMTTISSALAEVDLVSSSSLGFHFYF